MTFCLVPGLHLEQPSCSALVFVSIAFVVAAELLTLQAGAALLLDHLWLLLLILQTFQRQSYPLAFVASGTHAVLLHDAVSILLH